MHLVKINCAHCGKKFSRKFGQINEANKFGWHQYCSKKCQNRSQTTKIKKICSNPDCRKKVSRSLNQFKKSKSGHIFCSSSCAAIFNNFRKRKIKKCPTCGKQFYGTRKYCSKICYYNWLKSRPKIIKITKIQIVNKIKDFYKKQGRIPLKEEFSNYSAAQKRFGSWNKAVKAAGFKPNPVMFSKKFIANDGHICDSFTEKIIDDWLSEKKIKHKRNVPYPENKKLTVDFLIKDNWIEFFGLKGELKSYDEIVKRKQKLCKKYKLSLIEIYPKDLFPVNRLSEIIKTEKTNKLSIKNI